MADKKISQLTALSAANLAPSTDVLAIVDTSATETKKIAAQDIVNGVLNVASAVGIGTASPSQKLHVVGNSLVTPSGGWTTGGVATQYFGDIYGSIKYDYNTTNFLISSYGSFSVATNGTSPTTRLTVDTSGNLGLGVTPSAWGAGSQAMQNGGGAVFQYNNDRIFLGQNNYIDASFADKFIGNGYATRYRQYQGTHAFFVSTASNSSGAGASASFTQAMTLDASGNLLVGTTTPALASTVRAVFNDPDAGGIELVDNNNGGVAIVPTSGGGVEFVTFSGAIGSESYTERARITSGGDFEIGTQAGTGTRTLTIQTNTSGDPTLVLSAAGADSGQFWFERSTVRLYARASNTGGVYLASGGTSWTAVSDERKKDIIEPITNAAEKVASLRAVVGKYKTDKDGVRRSFLIAQDVQAVFPEAIDASDENELGLSYTDTIPLLVAAIKELKAELDSAKAKIAALEAK